MRKHFYIVENLNSLKSHSNFKTWHIFRLILQFCSYLRCWAKLHLSKSILYSISLLTIPTFFYNRPIDRDISTIWICMTYLKYLLIPYPWFLGGIDVRLHDWIHSNSRSRFSIMDVAILIRPFWNICLCMLVFIQYHILSQLWIATS